MPAQSKNVVFNQSRLMQGCWENKQPTLNPSQLHMSLGFSFSVVILCQGSALMSCMHSCRECVLPFPLSLLATIAAVKKTNKKEKAQVFAGASKLSTGQNHFEAFMLCQLWQTGIGAESSWCLWNLIGIFLLPSHSTNVCYHTIFHMKISHLCRGKTSPRRNSIFKVNSKPLESVGI